MSVVRSMVLGAALALGGACVFAGCGTTSSVTPGPGVGPDASGITDCPPCVTDTDCSSGVCAQLGADSYCAPACPNGNECAADRDCISANTISGDPVRVCAARSEVCGGGAGADAGATVGTPPDAGAPVTGQVGASGGTLSRLLFAVVGDTRPAFIEDTAAYPVAIVTKIFADIEGFNPHPPFVVATGDYMFASAFGSQAAPQLDRYLKARSQFSGVSFPALGNHECTGATTSNCGAGNANGLTNNYSAFVTKMLGPIQKPDPYYAVPISASDGSWTAKFLFVAANAWSDAQAKWFESAMAQDTTYTFVVRHESSKVTDAPGVKPSEAIMARHPYTLAIVGHTHTYAHFAGREVVIGNGGAPLTGTKNYGFGIFNQRSDGTIQVDMIDYQSGTSDARFRFAVHPDGSPAP